MDERLRKVESASASSTTPWAPPQPQRSPATSTTASTYSYRPNPDDLVFTGFPRDTHSKVRSEVITKVMAQLPQSEKHFSIQPKFLHSNLCFIVKKPSSPTAVISQILEGFKVLSGSAPLTVEHNATSYDLSLRTPIPPARLRRNAILTQAKDYIKAHGKNLTKDVEICWTSGVVKHGTTVLFGCDMEGGKAYYEAILEHGLAKEPFAAQLDRPAVALGKRL